MDILNRGDIMYNGSMNDFLKEKKMLNYDAMSSKEIITNYLEVLRCALDPLYPVEARDMINIIECIEKHVTKKMLKDLVELSDKDLILEYNLKPQTVSSKYVSVDVETIKPLAVKRIDVIHARNMAKQQYDTYAKRGWI